MSSKLYAGARATLSRTDKQSLAAFDKWLRRVRERPAGDPVDGRQLCENLKAEAHLTGAGVFGDMAALAGFLAHCARSHRGTKGMALRVNGYPGAPTGAEVRWEGKLMRKKATTERTPRWKDGRIDPDWLGSAGLRFVRPWLQARLSGRDPYQPIDVRAGEDPDAFVASVLREVGAQHPAFDLIARSTLDLLDEAAKEAPAVPAWFGSLLRICQQVRLPLVGTWFAEELGKLAGGVGKRNEREERWGGYEVAKEIVYAAAIQSPGFAGAASRAAWQNLLDEPRYTTIALLALSQTFPDRVRHLARWWAACNVDERERELEQILRSALRDEGEKRARELLLAHEGSLPQELRHAIDATMRRLGGGEVFVAPSIGATPGIRLS